MSVQEVERSCSCTSNLLKELEESLECPVCCSRYIFLSLTGKYREYRYVDYEYFML
jgi:hypothetical protein